MEVTGKVAIVTGGGSGIGRASAIALARAGAQLLVVDVDDAGGQETVTRIREEGGDAAFHHADVSAPPDVLAMVATAESRFGGLDILHNNAGLLGLGGFAEQPVERLLRMIEVNFTGVVLGTHAAIPAMRRRGGGAIVQTASIAGVIAYPGSPIYAATKAGVVSFTRALGTLKQEANINVNCLCPEVVDTPPIRLGRERNRAAGVSTPHMALPAIPVEVVGDAVVALVRDDGLAGRALKISPGRPHELLDFPDFGVVR